MAWGLTYFDQFYIALVETGGKVDIFEHFYELCLAEVASFVL